MKIGIMGAGGVGGYYGAFLGHAGHEVGFVARGAHLDAIRDRGLKLVGPRGDISLPDVKASDDAADIGPCDVVLFSVKLYDTETAAEAIRPMIGPETLVISLMNGVDGPERIAAVLPDAIVMPGAAYVSALITEPGVVTYKSDMSSIVFGEAAGGPSARAEAFAQVCRDAGFEARVSENATADLWNKFVLLATNSALTAGIRKPAGEIYTDPDLQDLARSLMAEVVAVGRAKGIDLDPDIIEKSVAMTHTFPPGMYASMFHDLDRGKRMEVDSLSGYVVREGAKFGIPTPRHHTIWAMLKPYRDGARV